MKKTKRQLLKIAKNLDWEFTEDEDVIEFRKYSDLGQDFSFCIGSKDLIGNLDLYISDFDVSEQTYIWLDSSGHGKNGAPYEMIDVYMDMEQCKEMMEELLYNWKN